MQTLRSAQKNSNSSHTTLLCLVRRREKRAHLVTPPIKFKSSGLAPLTQLTTWDKMEGHDPDPKCNTAH